MGVTSLREIKENMAEEKLAFRLPKGKMVPIWIECDSKSELLGYGLDNGEELSGQKLWGEKYYLSERRKIK